ncbi:MAG: hypothetical protein ACXWL5_01235 [Candidatus Chromulinivorax sp.]
MNKRLLLSITLFSCIIFGYYAFDFIQAQTLQSPICDSKQQVIQPIKDLLRLTDVQVDAYDLSTVVAATQKAWLRKDGSERWDIIDLYKERKDQFLKLFDQLQLIDTITPAHKHYDYLLLMGAAAATIEKRIATIIKLAENEIDWDCLIFLGGQRPLTQAEIDFLKHHYNANDNCPTTETEMMHYIYNHLSSASNKLHVKKFKTVTVDVLMKIDKQGVVRRPTTADTVELWMQQENPKAGSCLVISNQPFIVYQDSITRSLLPKNFSIETVGSASTETNISVYLDTVARILYAEEKRIKQ